ncbi:MAG: pantetheine-phosphate adenylyltransferase [Clostridia bacterium]|nr:pantetheine-phosphate adenylyltransferase [Clostridia bacterium]
MTQNYDLAIVPGSFDPMTLGHLDLIADAAKRYREVVVAVMTNNEKQVFFDMETRVRIAKASVRALPNVRVIADRGMLVDLFDRLGADAVCKGYRNETDLAYERLQDEWNCAHNPRFRTELIHSCGEHATLSSTAVRERIARGEALNGFVADAAIPIILKNIKQF